MEVFEVSFSLPPVEYWDTVLLLISAIRINFGVVPAVSDPVQEQKLPHGFISAGRAKGFPYLPQITL